VPDDRSYDLRSHGGSWSDAARTEGWRAPALARYSCTAPRAPARRVNNRLDEGDYRLFKSRHDSQDVRAWLRARFSENSRSSPMQLNGASQRRNSGWSRFPVPVGLLAGWLNEAWPLGLEGHRRHRQSSRGRLPSGLRKPDCERGDADASSWSPTDVGRSADA
jgi:hypothetical protein